MLYIVCFLVLVSHFNGAQSADCELPWVKVGNKCLWKSAALANRADNLKYCREVGATLATPRTLEENELLKTFIGSDSGWFWLGGQRYVQGNPEFRWYDGEAITYSNWNPGEPRDYSNPRPLCISLNGLLGWNDEFCDNSVKLPQICEKEIKSIAEEDGATGAVCTKIENEINELRNQLQEIGAQVNSLQTQIPNESSKFILTYGGNPEE